MSEQMKAGPELDRLVCEALTAAGVPGWELRIEWWLTSDGGQTSAMLFMDEESVNAYFNNPNHHAILVKRGFTIVKKLLCRSVSQSWADAGAALAAMHGLGWWARLQTPFTADSSDWNCGFCPLETTGWNGRMDHRSSSTTGPHAIALAILATLSKEAHA